MFDPSTDVWGFSTGRRDETMQRRHVTNKHELISTFRLMTQPAEKLIHVQSRVKISGFSSNSPTYTEISSWKTPLTYLE